MTGTPTELVPPGTGNGQRAETGRPPTAESARAQARCLWSALTQSRDSGRPGATAAAEDDLFRFYLPVARALGAGVTGTTVQIETARDAAEVALARAVLSWPGSDDGFLEFASRSILTVLRHLPISAAGPRHPLLPLDFSPLPGAGSEPAPGSRTSFAPANRSM